MSAALSQPTKPSLRGVSHQFAFFLAVAATAWLVLTHSSSTRATLVFGAALSLLFGTSALYHRVNWSTAARQRMRRADHAAIFVLIGGGYTPLFSLVASRAGGHGALPAIWIGAAIGVVKSLAWPHAPKWITAMLCVLLGWIVIGQVMDRAPIVGWPCILWLVASGVIYSAGAVVYGLKRPDPIPRVFGYHEVFHALVILASACLYTHVLLVLHHAPR